MRFTWISCCEYQVFFPNILESSLLIKKVKKIILLPETSISFPIALNVHKKKPAYSCICNMYIVYCVYTKETNERIPYRTFD